MMKTFALLLALCFVITTVAMAGLTIPPVIESDVSPKSGSLYLTNNALPGLDNYLYNYTFNFNLDDVTKKKAQDGDLILTIFNYTSPPLSHKNWINSSNDGTLEGSELKFNVNFTNKFNTIDFLGMLNYGLVDKKNNIILTEASGPTIIFNFRNERSEWQEGRYNYSVEAKSSINGSKVWILYKGSNGNWITYPAPRDYISTDEEWKRLEWNNMSYFQELEFVASIEQPKPISLYIEQVYENNASQTVYYITIKNSCDFKIYNIRVQDTLAANMEYNNSSYQYSLDEILGDPYQMNSNLAWIIGDLAPNKSKTIKLVTNNKNLSLSVPADNRVTASGFILGASAGFASSQNASPSYGPLR